MLSRRRLLAGGAAIAGTVAVGGATTSILLRSRGTTPTAEATVAPSSASPTATPTPSPSISRTPSPSRTTTPSPAATVEETLIPTTGAVRSATWQHGDPIGWSHGIFLMNTRSGVVQGFQATSADDSPSPAPLGVNPGGRFVSLLGARGADEDYILYDRESGASYVSLAAPWRLNNWTRDLIAFEGVTAPGSVGVLDGRIEIVSADGFETVTRASIPPSRWFLRTLFSPDGRALFAWALPIDTQPSLWRIDLTSGRVDEVWRPMAGDPTVWGDGGGLRPGPAGNLEAWVDWRPPTSTGGFALPAGVPAASRATLTWDGALVDEGPSPDYFSSRVLSPDGRFSIDPGYLRQVLPEADGPYERWSALTLHREPGHVPILRVRSAELFYGDWLGTRRWLADSSGFVALIAGESSEGRDAVAYGIFGTDGRLAALLPDPPAAGKRWFEQRIVNGPAPAPDAADLLSFGRLSVYRRSTGKWLTANVLNADGPTHLDPWATEASDEMAFGLPHGGHGGAGAPSLLAPIVEWPPFDDSLRFRVSGTGSCLNLREGPGQAFALLECLPEGMPLELALLAGRSFEYDASGSWARVVTPQGAVGWVSAAYLAWDIDG